MDKVTSYVKTENGNKIIIFSGDRRRQRRSFRCRQRSKMSDGLKCPSLRFVSYKEMQKEIKKDNKLIGPIEFYTISRL